MTVAIRRFVLWQALVVAFLIALALCPSAAWGQSKTASSIDAPLPAALLDALTRAGYRFEKDDFDADLVFFSGRLDNDKRTPRLLEALRAGKTLVLDINTPCNALPGWHAVLPLNDWSIREARLRRNGARVDFPEPVAFDGTYDLHVPGAAIENSQHRYLYEEYEKPLTNSDWHILATTTNGMPLLLGGRTGGAHLFVLGASWHDKSFLASPGIAPFLDRLVAAFGNAGDGNNAALSDAIELSIPDYQPEGLFLHVKNPGSTPVTGVISYQVSNWEREILNAETTLVELKGGETKTVPLCERGAFRGDRNIVELGASLPYRRIRAGVLAPDRQSAKSEIRRNVFVGPPVTISLVEDSTAWPKEEFVEEIDGGADGNVAKRFVWPTGSAPRLTIRVANRFANIAPLAEARDEITPENPTVEGLNDLSLSRANVRMNGKKQGGWDGGVLPEQRLSLTWDHPVVLAGIGIEAYGRERFENRSQPKNLRLRSDGKELLVQEDPRYTENGSAMFTRFFEPFAPQEVSKIELEMTKFNPQPAGRINLDGPTNCSIKELELYGWPAFESKPVASLDGEITITAHDLTAGTAKPIAPIRISVPAYAMEEATVTLPVHATSGPVRYDIAFVQDGKALAATQYDVFYLSPGHATITNKKGEAEWNPGLLCTPGWVQMDDFGKGMSDWTQGWGGQHDKIWAITHGLMETNFRSIDQAARMFTTDTRNSHYTNPWRFMPDGTYGWDIAIEGMLAQAKAKKAKSVWVVGSDRWNGIPIGHCFGWDMFVRFDKYLRDAGKPGLKARSLKGICDEIMAEHADVWQRWNLELYTEKIDETHKKFADAGIKFTFETHGSFPFAGGDIGDRLGATHAGVGTDLFWELRNQDLYWSLATRFAVVAANPNLASGMYKQWGWINSESNRFWYANNGPAEPARRQWVGTYFIGRIDSRGEFHPYHVLGYSMQGGVSTKFYPHEIASSLRTFNFTRNVRPEQPAGYGFVVSWDSHVRRMTPKGGSMGFGLYASGGPENQLDNRMGKLYEKLVKGGLPIGFVSSSHAMRNGKSTNPLVLLDASDWQGEELKTVTRLQASGTPIVGFGGDDQSPEALKFWTDGAEKRDTAGVAYFVRKSPKGTPLVYCPLDGMTLPAAATAALVEAIMGECGVNITTNTGLVVNPFIRDGALFLGLGSLSDRSGEALVRFNPGSLAPHLRGKKVRVIDLDRFRVIEPTADGSYAVPVEAVAGRMLMVVAVP